MKAVEEKTLSKQKYTHEDVDKITDENEKALIESAMRHANNSTSSRKFVNAIRKLARDRKTRYIFTNNRELYEQGDLVERKNITSEEQAKIKSLEEQMTKAKTEEEKNDILSQIIALKYNDTGGLVRKNVDGVETVLLNVDSEQSRYSVLGHEITHVLEGTEMYDALAEIAVNYAKTKGEYDTRLEALNKLYKGVYKGDDFNEKIQKELVADLVGDYLFTDSKFINTLCTEKPNLFKKIFDEIKYLCKVATSGSKQARDLEKLKKEFEQVWRESGKAQKNTTNNGGEIKYSLSSNAKTELHKALYDKNYRNEVLLRDETPAIMLSQKGVQNRKMVMNASHIRENVFTADEARNLGLKVDDNTHYHGIGEEDFLKIIDGLDNVKEAYRGTKNADMSSRRENYFLLVTEFKDNEGNTVIVPVYIEEGAICNRVYLRSNKIATVFGKDDFRKYISKQIKNKNLVRIKNKNSTISEGGVPLTPAYENTVLENGIPQNTAKVNTNPTDNSDINYSLSKEGNHTVRSLNGTYGEDIRLVKDDMYPTRADFQNTGIIADDTPIRSDIAPMVSETEQVETATAVFPDDLPIRSDIAPVRDNIAPVKETVTNNPVRALDDDLPIRSDLAPKTEEATTNGKQRKWVGTSTESDVVNREILPDDLDQNKIVYQPISNKATMNNANSRLDSMGYESV